MSIDRIAIIGAGTMGNGIAHVAAQYGKSVQLVDVSGEALDRAMVTITKNLERQVEKGAIDETERDAALGRITTSRDVAEGA